MESRDSNDWSEIQATIIIERYKLETCYEMEISQQAYIRKCADLLLEKYEACKKINNLKKTAESKKQSLQKQKQNADLPSLKIQLERLLLRNLAAQEEDEETKLEEIQLQQSLRAAAELQAKEELMAQRYSDIKHGTNLKLTRLKQECAELEGKCKSYFAVGEACGNDWIKSVQKRRKRAEEMHKIKGNIRVYCRIKPSKNKDRVAVECINEKVLKFTQEKKNLQSQKELVSQEFRFENIYKEDKTQEDVFLEVEKLVQSVLDGKNLCIFAYGQTGSGKTYTMQGDISSEKHRGIIPRSVQLIFDQMDSMRGSMKVALSILEIYLDTAINLFNQQEVRDEEENYVYVTSYQSMLELISAANKNRHVNSTKCNDRSSRSHLIVKIRVEFEQQGKKQVGCLTLVDLAGSERLKQSHAEGDVLKETKFINMSLLHLGKIISALKSKQKHIPFRTSKLTHILQSQLEGKSRVLMLVNVSPEVEDADITLTILRFSESVRECKLVKNDSQLNIGERPS